MNSTILTNPNINQSKKKFTEMKKLFSLFAAILFAGSMMAGVLVEYNGTATLPAGVTISGTTVVTNVKIHTNKDGVDCIQLGNGYSNSSVYNGNAIVLYTEGGFKAGDTLSVTGFFNNSSDTKASKVTVFTVDADNKCSAVWTSEQFINGRTVAADPTAQTYVLEADLDSIMLGRTGDTGTNLWKLSVTRPEAATINYWLVGPAAENGWDQTKAMPMANDQIVRHLAAGTYAFKVLTQEASWTGALGAADVNATASSANWYGDDNVNFELENEGDVTIKVVEGQIVLLGTFKKQESYDYYIKFAGNNWTWVGMTKVVSGNYIYEGVWGGVGANVNTSMSDNSAAWFPEANIMFLDESMEELPVPAVGTEGIYVYMPYAEPVLAFVYEAPAPVTLETFFISSAEINSGKVGDIALISNNYGSQAVDNPATWYTCAKGGYTFKGAKVCLAAENNGGGLQMQGNTDAAKQGFFGNAAAFNNIHSLKIVARVVKTSAFVPAFNVYTDSLGTTNALAAPDTVKTVEGNFNKYVFTYNYAEAGNFFNIKNDLTGALYIDTIYVTYEKKEAPAPEGWDGTATINKTSFTTLADLNGLEIKLNGASLAYADEEDMGGIFLQSKGGTYVYAIWHPLLGGTSTINGDVLTLNGFAVNTDFGCEESLPAEDAVLYVADYGSLVIDGELQYFSEDGVAINYISGNVPTTYTVTYTVTGFNAASCKAEAGYFNEAETISGAFVAGANTVPENVFAYVYVVAIDGYTVDVKVNGSAVTLIDGQWYSDNVITADMTIDITFTAPGGGETVKDVLKYSNFTMDATSGTGYQNFTYASTSGATYKAHMNYLATNDSIQLRSTQTSGTTYYSGVVNTVAPTGMYVKSVSVEWAAGTADGRQLNIFTVDASMAINDMFAKGATPNYTTLKSAGDKTFNVEGEHSYVGFCSQAGAMYIKSITVEWAKGQTTAIENTKAVKAVKALENGQVVIIREGVKYNVMGAKF